MIGTLKAQSVAKYEFFFYKTNIGDEWHQFLYE